MKFGKNHPSLKLPFILFIFTGLLSYFLEWNNSDFLLSCWVASFVISQLHIYMLLITLPYLFFDAISKSKLENYSGPNKFKKYEEQVTIADNILFMSMFGFFGMLIFLVVIFDMHGRILIELAKKFSEIKALNLNSKPLIEKSLYLLKEYWVIAIIIIISHAPKLYKTIKKWSRKIHHEDDQKLGLSKVIYIDPFIEPLKINIVLFITAKFFNNNIEGFHIYLISYFIILFPFDQLSKKTLKVERS